MIGRMQLLKYTGPWFNSSRTSFLVKEAQKNRALFYVAGFYMTHWKPNRKFLENTGVSSSSMEKALRIGKAASAQWKVRYLHRQIVPSHCASLPKRAGSKRRVAWNFAWSSGFGRNSLGQQRAGEVLVLVGAWEWWSGRNQPVQRRDNALTVRI